MAMGEQEPPVAVRAVASSVGWLALICRRYSPPFSTMMRAVSFWQCSGSGSPVGRPPLFPSAASAVMVLPSSGSPARRPPQFPSASSAGRAVRSCWAAFNSQRSVFSF